MPFVHITTWPVKDEGKIIRLQEDITFAVHKHTGAPLDKISVVISEIHPSRWADAGFPETIKIFRKKAEGKITRSEFCNKQPLFLTSMRR
ncbi:MAG: tautomerase family protein [Enterobacteriaceae bacterium]